MGFLLAGIALLCFTVLLFFVTYKATRLAVKPFWVSDAWVANLHAPLMVAMLTFGVAYLVKFAFVAMA
ncbi:hypothetical protein DESUT3_38070 [Desulfuromonas versatilis]|uniref:Uncharacterized protein n=1 Tax=Desulfuromonas versatilis TaxID=2802975 RepID=A0ABN6E321_9BACT|nr:hypothetical protein [Desulfuromonas versatilis]BCR06738.1 hypothetical protein DESUT3_38070 [Desulfuromonas versatilis]